MVTGWTWAMEGFLLEVVGCVCVCDCGALQKVCLTFQRLQHVCVARKGVAKELKLLSLQLGQG